MNSLRSSSHLLLGLPTCLLVLMLLSSPGCQSKTLLVHLFSGREMILRAIRHFRSSVCFNPVCFFLFFHVFFSLFGAPFDVFDPIFFVFSGVNFFHRHLPGKIRRCPGLCLSFVLSPLQFLCRSYLLCLFRLLVQCPRFF